MPTHEQQPGDFFTVATDGLPVNGAHGLAVVAFFSSWCSVCPEKVPALASYLRTHRIGRDRVLAVYVGSRSAQPPYLAQLATMARVCIEPDGGSVATAFKVDFFPLFFLLGPNLAVRGRDWDPAGLPTPLA